eukprot:6202483-Pleurochrysis_carterae.AAC.2
MRSKVANAFWAMRNLTTEEGQALYGDKFISYDEVVLQHACSTTDPRCDQGHFGPQFMTFPRAFLLRVEQSLLSVDSSIEAMPYWDMSKDSSNGEYRGTDNYIFSDGFFGDYFNGADNDYSVTNGLFAYWPVSKWDSAAAAESNLADRSTCIANQWYKGSACSATGEVFMRTNGACSEVVMRNPLSQTEGNGLGGTYELLYEQACARKPRSQLCSHGTR